MPSTSRLHLRRRVELEQFPNYEALGHKTAEGWILSSPILRSFCSTTTLEVEADSVVSLLVYMDPHNLVQNDAPSEASIQE